MPFSFLLLLHCFIFPQISHQFRVFHTSDIHGWINGHRRASTMDATFADYKNLLVHANTSLPANTTLLSFDCGDLIQGTGLSDSTTIPGSFIQEVVALMDFDGRAPGNREWLTNVLINHVADTVYPAMKGRYLAANIKHSRSTKPLADPYRIITIPDFGSILVIGAVEDESGTDSDCTVTEVSKTFTEEYIEIIESSDIVLIIILISAPPSQHETLDLRKKFSSYSGNRIPLLVLTGESHEVSELKEGNHLVIESYTQFQILTEIRFTLVRSDSSTNTLPTVSFSNVSVERHTTSKAAFQTLVNKSESEWKTKQGTDIQEMIDAKSRQLELHFPIACSPKTYLAIFNNSIPSKASPSLYPLVTDTIFPKMDPMQNLISPQTPKDGSKLPDVLYMINSNSLQAHLFEGDVYRDDVFSIDPYQNTFSAIENITFTDMKKLLAFHGELIRTNSDQTSNEINNFTNVYQVTSFKMPTAGKETSAQLNHIFSIVTNNYDCIRILPALNSIASNGKVYTQTSSSLLTRTTFEDYFRQHLKCTAATTFDIVLMVSLSVVFLCAVGVGLTVFLLCLKRRKRKMAEERWKQEVEYVLDETAAPYAKLHQDFD
ncbi:putative phosphoprotein phosphatase [Blattamonas nauphoetae]|uniref:Phosphoprotein phosphatase n=1 Tax=Blattamonas nauphoetae TaxID=2049346 RepID=A0ABQ9Y648_9EUKA|nr:putative phosphoprotein phosphatase [Blattamonas nauphoetae]